MGAVAFLFGGPGLAAPGMAKDLYNRFPLVRESMDKADKALDSLGGVRATKACFAGTQELVGRPSVAAPAVLAVAHGVYRTLRSRRLAPQLCAGLGWGAWVAAAAQGVCPLEEALRLLHGFGLACERAWEGAPWHALALRGLPVAALEAGLASQGLPVRRLALLGPEHAVLGGDRGVLEPLRRRLAGAGRGVQASGVEPGWQWPDPAFAPAAEAFVAGLAALDPEPLAAPLLLGGQAIPKPARDWLPKLAVEATAAPDWSAAASRLRHQGVDTVVEVGHGSELGAALRSVDPGLRALSTGDGPALAQSLKLAQA